MNIRPGGMLSTRPLNIFWVVDCSGSMALDNKMTAVNDSIRKSLPAMQEVAAENPNAQVYIQTLRFSESAEWMQTEPIALEQFDWQDLQADELPQTAEFSSEFRRRLDREGGKSGDVQISLMWNNYNDLDLHVITPSNEKIYFKNKKSTCNGELDVDMNVSPTSEEPVENIYWPTGEAPLGHYKIYVDHFANHDRSGCQDPTNYSVAVNICGQSYEFEGVISHGDPSDLVYEFTLNENQLNNIITDSGGNTNLGKALDKLSKQLRIPPMSQRALPPVLVLISDGVPTDDFREGLNSLLLQPWGKKAIRLAIAIGQEVDIDMLQEFIGTDKISPLQANNPETLRDYIQWASTVAIQASSAPKQNQDGMQNTPLASPPSVDIAVEDVW